MVTGGGEAMQFNGGAEDPGGGGAEDSHQSLEGERGQLLEGRRTVTGGAEGASHSDWPAPLQ